MKKHRWLLALVVAMIGVNLVYGQDNSSLSPQPQTERSESRRRPDPISREQYERALIKAYKTGYQDALKSIQTTSKEAEQLNTSRNNRKSESDRTTDKETRNAPARKAADATVSDQQDDSGSHERSEKSSLPYQAFTGGFYAGVNSTRYRGEDIDGKTLTGRLGYQVGVFTRFGGRLYGQLGVEYFTSSSNFFSPGDSLKLGDISGRINTQWIQIPVYVGYKLAQSKRGISSVRLAVGAQYANRIGGSNTVQLDNGEIQSGTFLALGNLGFDLGPLMIDVVYHHGLRDAINGFANSQRRSVGLNVGFKF